MSIDVLAPRALGRTGWKVTALCVGTGELGDMAGVYAPVPEEQAMATARSAFAGPLNFVDTSNGYGVSEQRLGSVLREIGGVPPGLLLATKVDPVKDGPFDGPRTRESVRESLDRLGVDFLPLLHLHDPERIGFEAAMAPGGPVEVMKELVAEGVVGSIGVAGGPIDLLRRFAATGAFDVVLTHNRWTLLDHSAEPLLAEAADFGVAVLNGAPFGGGLLAKGPSVVQRYCYAPAPAAVLEAAERIEAACARHGVPLAAAALQDSLRDARITSTVVGASRPERIDATIALASVEVPDALWDELAGLEPPAEVWQR
ncbi:D-threo-aldose 1-dehydrogenase [Motilibacter peucedani]|uniref:D-threo-aldose 1-dehydrogenase n=1 Tax=Motilibacter peucedani TaxID=598650 RepID=A0A420XRN8_9ACTN|nr:aldo/keto reductase [Motilibacter peucedani]RKS77471.1 D-threo-aldose 1-dehydrogenase [Motilibacter peucedani]